MTHTRQPRKWKKGQDTKQQLLTLMEHLTVKQSRHDAWDAAGEAGVWAAADARAAADADGEAAAWADARAATEAENN